MKVILAVLGFGILFLCLDAALDVEEAHLGVYHGRACPLIANEIHLLKVCAIVTAIAIPAAIGWFLSRLGRTARDAQPSERLSGAAHLVHAGDREGPATRFVLRLWRSDVEVRDDRDTKRPLWIGTVVEERMEIFGGIMTATRAQKDVDAPRDVVGSMLVPSRVARRSEVPLLMGWDGLVLLADEPRIFLRGP